MFGRHTCLESRNKKTARVFLRSVNLVKQKNRKRPTLQLRWLWDGHWICDSHLLDLFFGSLAWRCCRFCFLCFTLLNIDNDRHGRGRSNTSSATQTRWLLRYFFIQVWLHYFNAIYAMPPSSWASCLNDCPGLLSTHQYCLGIEHNCINKRP